VTAEREWCTFHFVGMSASGKTRLWEVRGTGGDDDLIGRINWHGPWRQYVFVSQFAIYNPDCLRQIADFTELITLNHRKSRATDVKPTADDNRRTDVDRVFAD
jgi:hypothetical protein